MTTCDVLENLVAGSRMSDFMVIIVVVVFYNTTVVTHRFTAARYTSSRDVSCAVRPSIR